MIDKRYHYIYIYIYLSILRYSCYSGSGRWEYNGGHGWPSSCYGTKVIKKKTSNHIKLNIIIFFLENSVAVNRVATYRELDKDLLQHSAFLTLVNSLIF